MPGSAQDKTCATCTARPVRSGRNTKSGSQVSGRSVRTVGEKSGVDGALRLEGRAGYPRCKGSRQHGRRCRCCQQAAFGTVGTTGLGVDGFVRGRFAVRRRVFQGGMVMLAGDGVIMVRRRTGRARVRIRVTDLRFMTCMRVVTRMADVVGMAGMIAMRQLRRGRCGGCRTGCGDIGVRERHAMPCHRRRARQRRAGLQRQQQAEQQRNQRTDGGRELHA